MNPCEFHDFGPLLGLLGDVLLEIVWRTREDGAAQLGQPSLHLGISKTSVDFFVQSLDEFCGRALRRADAPVHQSGP